MLDVLILRKGSINIQYIIHNVYTLYTIHEVVLSSISLAKRFITTNPKSFAIVAE